MANKYKSKHMVLLVLLIALPLILAGCGGSETEPPEPPDTSIEDQAPAPVRDLVLSYIISNIHTEGGSAYYASDAPDVPQEGDFRIDSLAYAGEANLYETIGTAYEIKYSIYWFTQENENSEGAYDWHQNTPIYMVLNRSGYDNSWDGVLGISYEADYDKKIEDIIFEVAYGIWDIDVSVKFDAYPQYVGPGSTYIPLSEEPEVEILKEYEPIYYEGDYWLSLNYKGFTALCYHGAEENADRINSLEITRDDLATHRGIRIGMSRDEVLSAYPAINDTPYWSYEGDYLWFGRNEEGFGMALIFWFQDDMVTSMQLLNMFN